MNCFNDRNGKQWTLDLNVGSAMRVKAETGFDIVNVIQIDDNGTDTTSLQKLSDDVFLMVSVLYSLCKQQVTDAGLSDEEFAECFDATTVESALDALVREIINFSQPMKKKMLALIYEKTQSFRAKAEQHLEKVLESKEFENELEGQLNSLLTNSQESSESTQGHSRSDS